MRGNKLGQRAASPLMTEIATRWQRVVLAMAVALCVGAPSSAYADIYTDAQGQTWTYTVNGRAATLTSAADKTIAYLAEDFPWMFTNNGTNYTVTVLGASVCSGWEAMTGTLTIPSTLKTINNGAFNACKGLTGLKIEEGVSALPYRAFYSDNMIKGVLIIPHSVTDIGYQSFLWTGERLTSVWVKGPKKVASGTQPYTSIASGRGNILYVNGNLGLKVALFGPYTKTTGTGSYVLHTLNKCTVYVPRNGYWLEENLDSYFSGTSKTVLFYGPGEELDISIDEAKNVLTATPTTVHALTNVMASAALFKSDFGLDTKISITNAFTYSASTFKGTTARDVSFERLMFSVKTQAELTEILTAFPVPVKLAIDPAGLTGTLSIPGDREIHVKIGDGYTVKKRTNGFEILIEPTGL